MSKDRIRIELLGGLTIWRGEQKISSQESRSRNIWLLLSYLIVHHDRVVPRKELTKILWGDENSNGVKTVSYRARTVLNRLGEDSGRELLVQKEEGYIQRGRAFWISRYLRVCAARERDVRISVSASF